MNKTRPSAPSLNPVLAIYSSVTWENYLTFWRLYKMDLGAGVLTQDFARGWRVT